MYIINSKTLLKVDKLNGQLIEDPSCFLGANTILHSGSCHHLIGFLMVLDTYLCTSVHILSDHFIPSCSLVMVP